MGRLLAPTESTELPTGDDDTTGEFVLLVDSFDRATYVDGVPAGPMVRFVGGERLHLSDLDANRLLNTDPPAVRRYNDPEQVLPTLAGAGWVNGRV